MALFMQSKNGEAIQAFDKAIEINPQLAEAWNDKGMALMNLGKS
jgi:Flp pilus assembly protein TadD